MINVSNEFFETMRERTDFYQHAKVTLQDGTVLEFDKDNFTVGNNSYTDGPNESTFPLGIAIEKSIQIELYNDDESLSEYDFLGAKIDIWISFELSETTETITLGSFTVLEPETRGETIIISAVDDMHKADKAYETTLEYPASLKNILIDICSSTGIPIYSANFQNNFFVVNEKPNEVTFRQMIGYIAMIAGGNARIRRTGELEILSYKFNSDLGGTIPSVFNGGVFLPWTSSEEILDGGTFSPWSEGDTVDGGTLTGSGDYHILFRWMNRLTVDTDDIVITGLQVDGSADTETILVGSEGYVISVDNPLIAGKEKAALQWMGIVLIGGTFRKFEGEHIGYPLAEFMDPVLVVDRKGNVYPSVITDIEFNFLGPTSFKNSAESALRNSSKFNSKAAEVYRKTVALVEKEKTAREKAVEGLNQTLANSSGMYATEETQDDGSTIYYLHDKPTIEESQAIIKITSEAIGVSNDGGETYPYGITMDGETIMRIIQTEGINADWISTGALLVKDSSGTVVFSVDVDAKKISFVNGYFDSTGAHFTDGYFAGTVTGSTISGSKITTQNTSGSEVIVMEKGKMTFYSEPDANLDDDDIAGYIQPGTTTAPVGNYEYEFTCIKLQSTEWAVLELWAGNDKVMQAIPTDGDVAARALFPLYVDVQKSLEVYEDLIIGGNLYCYGADKDRVVKTENYGDIGMSAFETASPYFADIGSGVIDENGVCTIVFDEVFSETLDSVKEYQVFITTTSEGNARCIRKNEGFFEMKGDPGATFDYMICATQKGCAHNRLKRIVRNK